jgi:hypothetical protein
MGKNINKEKKERGKSIKKRSKEWRIIQIKGEPKNERKNRHSRKDRTKKKTKIKGINWD